MPNPDETAIKLVVQPQTTAKQRRIIYLYVGFLFFAIPFMGVWGTSARFFLKDNLHMSPDAIAGFLFYVNIPAYLGFAFGFIRDRWNPFGRRDQGILILVMALSCVLLLTVGAFGTTLVGLIFLFIASSVIGQFLSSAQQGLTSLIGQEHVMSGRLASLWQAAAGAPGLVIAIVAGFLAKFCTTTQTLLIGGCIALAITLFTLWRPQEVFDSAETAPIVPRKFGQEAMRLLKTPALYPIVLLLFIWNFTPGVGTPIQFYLTDTLHGDASQYGLWNSIFGGFFIPTYLLYGYLCTRVKLRPLLWVCTFIAVPQILPLLIVHDANSAMIAAVPMGLMGGLATAAYYDLLIRACPPGLQGAAMMLGASAWTLSGELGNVAGAKIFAWGGFAPCAWATAIVYAFLIPVLALVPKHLTATRDGEVAF